MGKFVLRMYKKYIFSPPKKGNTGGFPMVLPFDLCTFDGEIKE